METTIKNGEFIIIDTQKIGGVNDIYIIVYEDKLYYKRISFNFDGTIDIISDNKNCLI